VAEKLRVYRQAQPRPGKALTGLAARSLEEEVKGSLGEATSIMQRFARSMTGERGNRHRQRVRPKMAQV